jgi:hypothetical protein
MTVYPFFEGAFPPGAKARTLQANAKAPTLFSVGAFTVICDLSPVLLFHSDLWFY